MLDAAVAREIEDRFLAETGRIEIAIVHDQFVVLGLALGDDLALRVDDACCRRSADARPRRRPWRRPRPRSSSGRRRPAPTAGGGTWRLSGAFLALLRINRGRVVAEHDHLDALQAHDAVGLRPAPVIADAHAENAAEHAPHRKAEIAGLEIALLEMLECARSWSNSSWPGRCTLRYLPTMRPSRSTRIAVLKWCPSGVSSA